MFSERSPKTDPRTSKAKAFLFDLLNLVKIDIAARCNPQFLGADRIRIMGGYGMETVPCAFIALNRTPAEDVRYRAKSRKHLLAVRLSYFDPIRTLVLKRIRGNNLSKNE
jgi:hypothetical protein